MYNALWFYDVLWTLFRKNTLIAPTKLSNLGMIKPSSPFETVTRGLYTQLKRILRMPCSEEFDPAANFSPFLFPPEILFIKHLFPTSREVEGRWEVALSIYSTEN